MKTIVIGYSKIKLGITLLGMAYVAVCPILIYILAPWMLSFERNFDLEMVLLNAIFIVGALASLGLLVVTINKYITNKEAILIYQDGIWSNVSGLKEKFIPWSHVEKAIVQRAANGLSIVKVVQKEPNEEHAQRSRLATFLQPKPTMALIPILLEKHDYDLTVIINDYVEQYNQAQVRAESSDTYIAPLAEHMKKKAA